MTKRILPRMAAGQRYGRLVAIEHIKTDKYYNKDWLFICDCGRLHVAQCTSVRAGNTRSCGCLQREKAAKRFTKHGMYSTPEHSIWSAMLQRCLNKKNPSYSDYGGRGIKVCQRWMDFSNFIADVGLRPSPELTLDRINNDGDYEPNNVRWATRAEQQYNRRKPKMLGGARMTKYAVAMLSFGS